MNEVFEILENDTESWERTEYGDIWAMNYDRAIKVLKEHKIKTPERYISYIADFYGLDVV